MDIYSCRTINFSKSFLIVIVITLVMGCSDEKEVTPLLVSSVNINGIYREFNAEINSNRYNRCLFDFSFRVPLEQDQSVGINGWEFELCNLTIGDTVELNSINPLLFLAGERPNSVYANSRDIFLGPTHGLLRTFDNYIVIHSYNDDSREMEFSFEFRLDKYPDNPIPAGTDTTYLLTNGQIHAILDDN